MRIKSHEWMNGIQPDETNKLVEHEEIKNINPKLCIHPNWIVKLNNKPINTLKSHCATICYLI